MSTRTQEVLLVELTGSNSATSQDEHRPSVSASDCIAELESVASIVEGKHGDPGPLYPVRRRVAVVINELESRLAKANLTIEAIGRRG